MDFLNTTALFRVYIDSGSAKVAALISELDSWLLLGDPLGVSVVDFDFSKQSIASIQTASKVNGAGQIALKGQSAASKLR